MSGRLIRRTDRPRRRSAIRLIGAVVAPEAAAAATAAEFSAVPDTGTGAGLHADPSLQAAMGVVSGRISQGVLVAFAREVYNIRRRRSRFLPADLFGEPTWDILLDLYVATREHRPVPTTSACIGAHVPPTTALRWLRILEARGMVEREEDGRDGRRTFVRLSEQGLAAMEGWLNATLSSMENSVGTALRHSGMNAPMAEAAE